MASAQTAEHWYIIVRRRRHGRRVGQGGRDPGRLDHRRPRLDTNGNNRWPDIWPSGCRPTRATAKVAVMNQGIGGNAVTSGGLGPTGVRAATCATCSDQSGVKYVDHLRGGQRHRRRRVRRDDHRAPSTSSSAQAHAQSLLIYGATITPFGGNSYYSAAHETVRQGVNTYIRSGKFDGCHRLRHRRPGHVEPAQAAGDLRSRVRRYRPRR